MHKINIQAYLNEEYSIKKTFDNYNMWTYDSMLYMLYHAAPILFVSIVLNVSDTPSPVRADTI